MKLRTKIQLFTSIFMLVLILLINTSIYFLFYKNSVDSEIKELAEQTVTIVSTINNNPDIPPTELLKAFLPADGMIRVFPKEGDPLVHTKTKEYIDLPGSYSKAEKREVITINGKRFATVSKPIIWNTGDVVTIQMTKELVSLSENMRILIYVLSIASVMIIIPIVIAGNILARFLLLPIKSLISTMKENMKHGKWKKIKVKNRSKDELHEMEETFNDMIDYLKENYEMQEIFVSDASHELKTPISIIKSYAQLLARRGKDNPELIHESVEAIGTEADRMQKLVEQLLALAKNKEVLHQEKINLSVLLEDSIGVFVRAYHREIPFQCEKALFVNANRDQLKQVFYILIDNALKYSEEQVDVSIDEIGNNVVVQVIDYGTGIPDSEQERIFERFYRVDKARSRNTGGTGLGLAIANTIITAHGGTLSVTSKLGEGSTFSVILPAFDE
ncbi:sensor histidine kinase [Ornithinibacillus bavariensis]|uniref:sensor histidine kinase n=1 Tax=Ornithinibacillus bavariensis TaxID=545502 RepID=UPI000ECD52DE|nr:sensor histidine kinase [Ornithinibacillus sp.]